MQQRSARRRDLQNFRARSTVRICVNARALHRAMSFRVGLERTHENDTLTATRVETLGALEAGCLSRTRTRSFGMPQPSDWKVPASAQPKPEDYRYDLDQALGSVVGVHSMVPPDAFSAETLGTERGGNGVLIRDDGVVLTIGYLITEADQVWLTFSDGKVAPGHVLGYDQETGFGLVQALARVELPALSLGQSSDVAVGDRVVVGGAGGRRHSVAARIARPPGLAR